LAQSGHNENAARIFHKLNDAAQCPIVVRRACLKGLLVVEPATASNLLAAALSGEDDSLRGIAVAFLAHGPDEPPLASFLGAFKTYPPPAQIALLEACRERGES